jgi:hypothetical protein
VSGFRLGHPPVAFCVGCGAFGVPGLEVRSGRRGRSAGDARDASAVTLLMLLDSPLDIGPTAVLDIRGDHAATVTVSGRVMWGLERAVNYNTSAPLCQEVGSGWAGEDVCVTLRSAACSACASVLMLW